MTSMYETITNDLLSFIRRSPSCYHAVTNLAAELEQNGYRALSEADAWDLSAGGKYYVCRNGSSLLSFRIPSGTREMSAAGFMITAAHSDSPTFKIKENAELSADPRYVRLNTERYGGMLCSTWLDRPLSVAGKVVLRNGNGIKTVLMNIDRDLLLIPNVAIHMNRSANENASYNAAVDMMPVFSDGTGKDQFRKLIASEVGADENDILGTDLFLYSRMPGSVWGLNGEFFSAPRLDDLQCAYAALRGFLDAAAGECIPVLAILDNEEVGSCTRQGADSTFLDDCLTRICDSLHISPAEKLRMLAKSFMVSADNAHAVHPNHPEYADATHRPQLNGGIVIKFNAAQRYTTDAESCALFRKICADAQVPVQYFTNRSDLAGGSTLGNISNSHVSLRTVDIGLPQLAMHSSYETAGTADTADMAKALRLFFSASLHPGRDSLAIRYPS